jgi:hypothetical protein
VGIIKLGEKKNTTASDGTAALVEQLQTSHTKRDHKLFSIELELEVYDV